jgi:hypothetical protein
MQIEIATALLKFVAWVSSCFDIVLQTPNLLSIWSQIWFSMYDTRRKGNNKRIGQREGEAFPLLAPSPPSILTE